MFIFCSIIKKEIPAGILYEDEDVIAFLDISQVTKGHTLIVPKKHVETMLDCEEETLAHVMMLAKKIGNHLMNKLSANGMNVLSNVYQAAGQSVPHFHVHLIPRYDENDACIIHFEESEKQDLDALQSLLKL